MYSFLNPTFFCTWYMEFVTNICHKNYTMTVGTHDNYEERVHTYQKVEQKFPYTGGTVNYFQISGP